MCYLHSLDILHGDLTGGNILLVSSNKDARGFIAKVWPRQSVLARDKTRGARNAALLYWNVCCARAARAGHTNQGSLALCSCCHGLCAAAVSDAREPCRTRMWLITRFWQVADFGLSRVLSAEAVSTGTYGTVTHMPVELLTTGALLLTSRHQLQLVQPCAHPQPVLVRIYLAQCADHGCLHAYRRLT